MLSPYLFNIYAEYIMRNAGLEETNLESRLPGEISILQHSDFFTVQFSHPYMTTGKTIALTMDLCWRSNVSAFEYAI